MNKYIQFLYEIAFSGQMHENPVRFTCTHPWLEHALQGRCVPDLSWWVCPVPRSTKYEVALVIPVLLAQQQMLLLTTSQSSTEAHSWLFYFSFFSSRAFSIRAQQWFPSGFSFLSPSFLLSFLSPLLSLFLSFPHPFSPPLLLFLSFFFSIFSSQTENCFSGENPPSSCAFSSNLPHTAERTWWINSKMCLFERLFLSHSQSVFPGLSLAMFYWCLSHIQKDFRTGEVKVNTFHLWNPIFNLTGKCNSGASSH